MKKTIAATVLACALGSGTLPPPAAHAARQPADCGSLRGLRLPASVIGLPTRGGEVRAADTISPSGSSSSGGDSSGSGSSGGDSSDSGSSRSGSSPTGAYCRVEAVIHPVDPTAPDITLRVALPRQWNKKSMMFGGGGYDGTVPDVTGNVPFGPVGHPRPLARGYATYAGDSGHQAAPDFTPTPSLDGSFGLNDEAVRNFAGDALKKTPRRRAPHHPHALRHRPRPHVLRRRFQRRTRRTRRRPAMARRLRRRHRRLSRLERREPQPLLRLRGAAPLPSWGLPRPGRTGASAPRRHQIL